MNRTEAGNEKGRSQRWEEGLMALARGRGDAEAVGQRAVGLVRDLNLAPWIALAVAERILPLAEAQLLDRAARCKELQAGVLDKKLSVAKLKVTMPFAPYLLAAELMPGLPAGVWTLRELTDVLKAILGGEQARDEGGEPLPVRKKATSDYIAIVNRIALVMKETRCGLPMALEMALGRLTEAFVREYAAHRRLLDRESQARMMEEGRGARPYAPRQGPEGGWRQDERPRGPGGYGRRPDAPSRPRGPGGYRGNAGDRRMRSDRREPGRDFRARAPGG